MRDNDGVSQPLNRRLRRERIPVSKVRMGCGALEVRHQSASTRGPWSKRAGLRGFRIHSLCGAGALQSPR